MKPSPLDYVRATSVDHAVELLSSNNDARGNQRRRVQHNRDRDRLCLRQERATGSELRLDRVWGHRSHVDAA